jgi:hypothetical protein
MQDILIAFGNYGLILSYILVAVTLLAFIGFELFHLATNLKESKGQLLGAGALIVVLIVSWILATGDFTFPGIEKFNVSSGSIRLIDMGLIASLILFIIAGIGMAAAVIVSSVRK